MMSRYRVDRLQSFLLEQPDLGVASAYVYRSHSIGRHWDRVLGLALLLDPTRHPDPATRSELLSDLAPDVAEAAGETRLDLVALQDVGPLVARRIVTEGRCIVSADPELDRTFVRDVRVRAIDVEAFVRRSRHPRLETASR